MRLVISALTLTTLCGTTATAQPVARHLIEGAGAVEILRTEVNSIQSNATIASLFVLDDIDGDGVREILLTHADGPPSLTGDSFRTIVRSPGAGGALLAFPIDTTSVPFNKLAHASAIQIDDINGDGVRDIAVARAFAASLSLRVHSGANGEVLRSPFSNETRFPWGLSMTPDGDHDEDGQTDLLLGKRSGSFFGGAFMRWSPASGAAEVFTPDGLAQPSTGVELGMTILDLGIGASGAREFLSTAFALDAGPTPDSAAFLFGREPTVFLGAARVHTEHPGTTGVHSGAARLGDLNGDGHREIVLTGYVPSPNDPSVRGLPLLSGNIETPFPPVVVDPLGVHVPRMLIDRGAGIEVVEPLANRALVGIADSTGDGVEDYVFLGTFSNANDDLNPALVAMCGRTGRAFYAAAEQVPDDFSVVVEFTRPFIANGYAGQGAVVSPGDINDDGAPDVLFLVSRTAESNGGAGFTREQLLLTHYLPTPCVGDVDFDRVVNFGDLNAVLANFGAQDITLPADLNADGVVNFADLNLVLSAYGAACD